MSDIAGYIGGVIFMGLIVFFCALTFAPEPIEKTPISPVQTSKLKAVKCTVTSIKGADVVLRCSQSLSLPLP